MALKRLTGLDIAQEDLDGNPFPSILTIKDLNRE